MKPLNALALYGVRLRARLWQETFAAAGIAAGVALLFASQVASSSLESSVARLSHGIAGRATLQLQARDPHGLPQAILRRVRRLAGVNVAAPVLEVPASAAGPGGSSPVELVGVDSSLAKLGGTLAHGAVLRPFAGIGAVALSLPVSRAIGAERFGQEVSFQLGGHTAQAPLYTEPHEYTSGSLTTGDVAVAPLSFAQEMAGMRGRVSRVLIEPAAGSDAKVRTALEALAGGRLNVESVDHEQRLFDNAAAASNQSTALFSAISALVGFLFAFNAMLFTVSQRRRLVVDLRRDGYGARTVIALLALDAAVLGLFACALGLALGEELSIHVLHSNPAFLSLAFTLGSERSVGWQSIAIAIGGGMAASIVAVLSPLRDVLSRNPLAATGARESSVRRRTGGWAALGGLACLGAASAILLAAPDAAIPGMVLLVAALLLVLPSALEIALTLLQRLAAMTTGVVGHVAAMELSAAGVRAVAIAATGAMAVFGSVAIEGAHDNLLMGLQGAARDMNGFADVWVAPVGSYDLMDTVPFRPVGPAELQRLAGVRAVRPYRGGLLDYGARRALVMAPPRQGVGGMVTRQLVEGDASAAARRVAGGGWLVLSRALAAEHHLRIGQTFTLPSPHPASFRVAGISSNFGWAPGAIVMNASDYARAWGSSDVSAEDVLVAQGVAPGLVAGEIAHLLGSRSGLAVQTAVTHAARQSALSRQALSRLSQIATVIPIVAVLAMAAAIGAMIWQRRPRLAKLRIEGLQRLDLWRTVLLESAVLLGVGCLTGAVFGLYGQQLADRALATTVNFPVAYSITALSALPGLALMALVAMAILAVPGYLAASVPATLALQD